MDGSRSGKCNDWIDEFNTDTVDVNYYASYMGDFMIDDLFRSCW